jgi:hypothetical protein
LLCVSMMCEPAACNVNPAQRYVLMLKVMMTFTYAVTRPSVRMKSTRSLSTACQRHHYIPYEAMRTECCKRLPAATLQSCHHAAVYKGIQQHSRMPPEIDVAGRRVSLPADF